MTVMPATKRRIIWALSIGALLIAIVVGILTFVDLTVPVEETKRCTLSIWQSQWPKYIGCVIGVHEDLAAGLIGGAGALFAAWLAWAAVQEQLFDEGERRRREQFEAKVAAIVGLAFPVDAAAAVVLSAKHALRAKDQDEQEKFDEWTSLCGTFLRSTLESFTVREGALGLAVDDRVQYMTIIQGTFDTRAF